MQIDQTYIDAFEKSLNPVKPETSRLPFKILGYGEISSIFTMEKYPGIVFKGLPFFFRECRVPYPSGISILPTQPTLKTPA